jgi:hypothetical protein
MLSALFHPANKALDGLTKGHKGSLPVIKWTYGSGARRAHLQAVFRKHGVPSHVTLYNAHSRGMFPT